MPQSSFLRSRRAPHLASLGQGAIVLAAVATAISTIPARLAAHPPSAAPALAECSREPSRLTLGVVPAPLAASIAAGGGGADALAQRIDRVVTGACTKFVVDAANDVILVNGARWRPSGEPPALVLIEPGGAAAQRSAGGFDPPVGLRMVSIDGKAAPSLRFIESWYVSSDRRLALWSDGRRSMVATVACAEEGARPQSCTLGRVLLRSPYAIGGLSYLPSPDSTGGGTIRLWYRLPGDRIAVTSADVTGLAT